MPLSDLQKIEIREYAEALGMPKNKIYFYEHQNTAYGRIFDEERLHVGLDVLPKQFGNYQKANSRVSMRGAIAHEIVGHREAELAGMTQHLHVLEEAQASIRAARFAPGLNETERFILLRDGVERLRRENIKVRDIKDKLWISEEKIKPKVILE